MLLRLPPRYRKYKRLLNVGILAIFVFGLAMGYHLWSSASLLETSPNKKLLMCILGNAQSQETAHRMHQQWDSKFPSMWYLWGALNYSESLMDKSSNFAPNMHFFDVPENLTWAQGLHVALERLKKLYPCDYFFTHDDDLQFEARGTSNRIYQELLEIIVDYQPAVVGFPFDAWVEKRRNMARLQTRFGNLRVGPLTGFDSGMVIYHKSVVDFFIPFSPRGQGGFYGNWSLCAHYINMFAPLIFKENAIQINTIGYKNLINIDNIPKSESRKKKNVGSTGLVLRKGSRHPYEYKFNGAFKDFMEQGMWKRGMKWGRYLDVHDVTWVPSRGELPYKKWDVLRKIHSFYNISHPLIQENQWIQSHFSERQLNKLTSKLRVNAKIRQKFETQLSDSYDKCTLIITVFERHKQITSRLAFYHTLELLSSIVVIWNNPKVPVPVIDRLLDYQVPVHILPQSVNSLNNRFAPNELISTDCVINMDDDWEMPHHHIQEAVHLWKHHQDQIIGYKNTARTHSISPETKKFVYGKPTDNEPMSMVLPSGLVYHRKYLDLYSSEPIRPCRELVDKIMNCDDLLFNFVVANSSGLPPLVMNAFAKPKKMKRGLWKRPSHFTERSECLNTFADQFGYMPLKYTDKLSPLQTDS